VSNTEDLEFERQISRWKEDYRPVQALSCLFREDGRRKRREAFSLIVVVRVEEAQRTMCCLEMYGTRP